MAAYIVAQLKVHDPAMFQRYRDAVTPLVDRFGGRYRVRGGELEVLEGDWPLPAPHDHRVPEPRRRPAVLRFARVPEDPAAAAEVSRWHAWRSSRACESNGWRSIERYSRARLARTRSSSTGAAAG